MESCWYCSISNQGRWCWTIGGLSCRSCFSYFDVYFVFHRLVLAPSGSSAGWHRASSSAVFKWIYSGKEGSVGCETTHTMSEWLKPSCYQIWAVICTLPVQVLIRRRPLLYVVGLLIPSIFLMLVDITSFYLPLNSRTRIVFKISILLGYTLFRVNITEELPSTAVRTPLIGCDFCVCFTGDSIQCNYPFFLSPWRCVLCGLHGSADAQPHKIHVGGETSPPQWEGSQADVTLGLPAWQIRIRWSWCHREPSDLHQNPGPCQHRRWAPNSVQKQKCTENVFLDQSAWIDRSTVTVFLLKDEQLHVWPKEVWSAPVYRTVVGWDRSTVKRDEQV